ncbi:MAG: penicillin acylase family protein [Myxococcota bacterium]
MKRTARLGLSLTLLLGGACHPLSCFHPNDLPKDRPLTVTSSSPGLPAAEVEVITDEWGIPHIFAGTEPDLAYGLGYMHGRDRTFQLMFRKFAALGRLSELLDRDMIYADQYLRLTSWRLDEQLAATSPRGLAILDGYAAGVNDGASAVGRSGEMALLGVDFEPFSARDVLACVRLLQDNQGVGRDEELVRARLLGRVAEDDPRRETLLALPSHRDAPVVPSDEHSGQVGFARARAAAGDAVTPHEVKSAATSARRMHPLARAAAEPALSAFERQLLLGLLSERETGASNSWVVHGEKTASGLPILVNDPHLAHEGPSLFYLAHLKAPDFDIAGVTFPGIPAVIIGFGNRVAWGITNAYADCQDMVRISPVQDREDLYWLDGQPMNYGTVEQTYRTRRGEDAPLFREVWKTTVFGPLVPPGRAFQIDEGERLAIMDCNLENPGWKQNVVTSLWDLGKAASPEDADLAAADLASPFMNLVFAFTSGDIAYRLSGQIPLRRSDERPDLPRDGRGRDAGWGEALPREYKPQLTNPAKGYFNATNQRLTDEEGPGWPHIGREGETGYRALRVKERVEALLAEKKPSADELLAIQQDVESVEARLLLPALAPHCPAEVPGFATAMVDGLCDALRTFDGRFVRDSVGALAFEWLWPEVRVQVAASLVGEDVAPELAGLSRFQQAVEEAFLEALAGGSPVLLDDPAHGGYEGPRPFVAAAAAVVLERLQTEIGRDPAQWTLGRVHTLSVRGRLAEAPVVGFLFATSPRPQDGCRACLRSERNTPITHGSGTRIVAEMSDPPSVRMVIDGGQSGHFGHRHVEDQLPRWEAGDPIPLSIDRATIEAGRAGWLKVEPQ